MQANFAEVYELNVDEDVNRVLFALPRSLQTQALEAPPAAAGKKPSQRGKPAKAPVHSPSPRIDGAAAGVKLLAPRLFSIVQHVPADTVADLNAMLQNLSLKGPAF